MDIPLGSDADDVDEQRRRNEQWLAAFEAHVEHEERVLARPGDDKHPLNVAKIMQGMGCIEGLCQVRIEQPYDGVHMERFGGPWHYLVRHTVPRHSRTYEVRNWHGAVVERVTSEVFEQRNSQIAVDPSIMRKLEDRDRVAEYIVKRLRAEWDHSWPHHA
jgi:hypothetical protein